MNRVKDGEDGASLVERVVDKLVASAGDGNSPTAQAAPRAPERDRATEPQPTTEGSAPPPGRKVHIDLSELNAVGVYGPDDVRTRTTEEFRMVKRTILRNIVDPVEAEDAARNPRLLMVTSCLQGEGKTFVSLNLAMSLAAERDLTVLLVDTDVSQSSVLKRLGIEPGKGLIDLLGDPSLELHDVLIRTDIEGLTILPAGTPHQFGTELLASEQMARLIAELFRRDPERVIIFDAPPVLVTSEPSTLAMYVGQIVFVVEASKTNRTSIQEALNLIGYCPNIGFVLNKVKFQFGSARFGSYYKSYNKSYYRSRRRASR